MATQHVRLIDKNRTLVATAEVADEGSYFAGLVDLTATPDPLRALFAEFEEIVNGQMFAFLSDIQAKIAVTPLHGVFEDGSEVELQDLQVDPLAGEVSFRLGSAGASSVTYSQVNGIHTPAVAPVT